MKKQNRLCLGFIAAILFLSSCSSEKSSSDHISQANVKAPRGASDQIYKLLLAEAYYYNNKPDLAADNILAVAAATKDTYIAERSITLAIQAEKYDEALDAALRWKTFDAKSTDLSQYLVLLYQEKGLLQESAKEMDALVKQLNKKSKPGLDMAVALLDQSDDTNQSYEITKLYTSQYNDTHAALYFEALFAFRVKKYEEVLATTNAIEKTNKKELLQKSSLLRVKAFTALNRTEEAVNELNDLIRDSADIRTKQSYARLMASLGNADKAVDLLHQIYLKNSDSSSLLLDIIAINIDQKKYKKTLPLIDELAKKKGQKSNAHYYRGLSFEAMKKYGKAVDEYKSIQSDKREMMDIQIRIVSSLEKHKGLSSALDYLHSKQKEIKNKTNLSKLYLLESDLNSQAEKYKEALLANQKAEALEPNSIDILYSQALLHENLEDIPSSEKTFKDILIIDKNNTSTLNALGYLLAVHTTRYDEALNYIKKANRFLPNDPAIIDSLGWVYFLMGDTDKAEKYLRQAYSELQDTEIAGHLIEVLAKKGKNKEAQDLLKKVLKDNPDDKDLLRVKLKLQPKS